MNDIPGENSRLTRIHSECLDSISDRLICMQDETTKLYKDVLAKQRTELAELRLAIERGGLIVGECRRCTKDVVCINDGLHFCEECAAKEGQ